MRPDLFAGPALREDSHRILARLANGGMAPAPARQWALPWNATQRARMAAVAALLALCAAAWVWQLDAQDNAGKGQVAPIAARPEPAAPAGAAPSQAATIVNAPAPPGAVPASLAGVPQPADVKPAASGGSQRPAVLVAGVQAAHPPLHQRAGKPAPAPRNPPSAADSDEDVTLLAAMLKHANPPKPAPAPPANR